MALRVLDLPPGAKSHPQTTPPEVADRIGALALDHSAYGCNRLEALLKAKGHGVSSVTIQKMLNERELRSRYQRWLALNAARPNRPLSGPASWSRSSKSRTRVSASAMSSQRGPASYCRPIRSTSANSK